MLHPDDGIIALSEKKSTIKKALNELVNEFYAIRRYFSRVLVLHSKLLNAKLVR